MAASDTTAPEARTTSPGGGGQGRVERAGSAAAAPVVEFSLQRRVQLAFVAAAVAAAWLLDRIITSVWDRFGPTEPDPKITTAAAVVLGGAGAWWAYRRPRIHQWAVDVVGEMRHVTWPSRAETWSATVVVLVVSFVSAAMLGLFDLFWAAVTDLVY